MRSEAQGLFGRGLLAAAIGLLACREPAKSAVEHEGDITAEHHKMPALPRTRLSLEGSFSRQTEIFEVEVAHTPEAITRGLMWRKSLKPREGMLFVFEREKEQFFWMKNTLVGLDMVFISAEQVVVGIVEHATPLSLSSLSVGLPSRYVLEVAAGTCAKLGIRAGSKVAWEAWNETP
ncbi:MAG: DUF192 domain-containing protein [Proteobacteria bacterium]|nr:DUF192 domain-containing protein [Cystobacterineae bacterium]MCL2258253.1 DUF192 domain-containing protein [Cystobacterineae bacterium]MCL2315414.1 DUF192 domain-containing protein [Pseudomonadota bacterium]